VAAAGVGLFVLFAASGPFDGDDAYLHTLWAQQYLTGVQQGVLRPCWVEASNAGCGSPTFLFYPPLAFWTYVPLHALAALVPRVVQASVGLALVGAGLSTLAVLRGVVGTVPALVAALMTLAAPYTLIDAGYRCAVGEVWALAFLPWVLGGLLLPRTGSRWRDPIWIAAGTTGLLLSHLPSAIVAVHVVPLAAGVRYLADRDLSVALARLAALPVAAAAAALFLVPMLAHWPHVSVENILGFHYADNFLWSDAAADRALNRMLSGVAVLGAVVCVVAAVAQGLVGRSVSGPAVAGLLCFAAMTPAAAPLWRVLPLLQVIGFPWRLLIVLTPCVALGVALALQAPQARRWRAPRVAMTAAVVLAVAATAMASVHVLSVRRCYPEPLAITPVMAEQPLRSEFARFAPFAMSMRDVSEYRPRWSLGHERGRPHDIVMPASFHDDERAMWITGEAVEVVRWDTELRQLRVAADGPAQLLLRTFYYPAWKATGDGTPLLTSPHEQSGLMLVDVPVGVDLVELRFTRDASHAVGWGISGATALLAALGLLLRWRLSHAR